MVRGVEDLPTGALTFLFTDLEGSTRLWQEQPEAMAGALARHDALLGDVIAAAGGTVFKRTGDGCHAAFSDPTAALRAAVDLQRAMSAERWGDVGTLRIRIALHSGTAQLRDGDYFGPTVNRVARILGVGHGGQILATAATIGLVPGTPLLDLGLHRLRDLTEAVRLYQIEGPGLAAAFPPLRSLERFHHNLPVQRSTFIGRDREIEQVRDLLGRTRLLTLTGAGGCGKTRLALAVAAHEVDRFPDGVFFVDLSVISDPSLVWSTVAEAVRITGSSRPARGEGLDAREAVLRYLAPATVLLLLDNCEHLVEECAAIANALLDRCPSALVLATSREALAIDGERVFRVPPLELPEGSAYEACAGVESVRLFCERATSADAGFVLDAGNLETVSDICRRLDGMPLAIELVASRTRHLPIAEIAHRLDDRFRFLTDGPRGATRRQQTLQSTIDWSHDLLREPERTLLRRCAVFVDGFTLDAAEGVCAGNGLARTDVVDVLGALVDKSLVALHGAERRYRLLETIRHYALDRLAEAHEAEPVRDRHCEWFLALGERAIAGRWWESSELSAADFENLRAAQAWAHGKADGDRAARLNVIRFKCRSPVSGTAGYLEQARRWNEAALAYEGLAPALRADLLAIASWRDIGAGAWTEAGVRARLAIALAPDPGNGLVPVAFNALATQLMVADPDVPGAAERVLDEGIERLRHASNPDFPVEWLLSYKMDAALMGGDYERALKIGREIEARSRGRPLARVGGDDPSLSFAVALHLLGRHAEAEEAARSLLARCSAENLAPYDIHLLLALTLAARGRSTDAGAQLRAAATIVRRDRYPLTLNDCLVACGALAARDGDLERASRLLASATRGGAVRSQSMFAIYRHYRTIVRAGLDRDTVRRCREEGRALDLVEVLDEELARRSV
jgi:predicted ATPase/class 3 adenylate cyclase